MRVADVKWIKITVDMFDNRKIKHLRRLPDGNNIVLIWVMLLTMAGRCNSNGMIFLTENIPYTPKMLADELDFEENTVQLALNALEQLNMIVTNSGFFTIAGWDEYQNVDGMAKIREQNRLRKQKQREKQKLLPDASRDSHGTVTESHATDIEGERELESETDIKDIHTETLSCQAVVDLYHSICTSFPRVRSLSEARKKAIKARLKAYTIDDFREVFIKAEASDFLKGSNGNNWSANFDWLLKDANIAKVLDGNYDNKGYKSTKRKEIVPDWMTEDVQKTGLDETLLAAKAIMGDSPELAERVKRLKEQLGTNK